MAGSDTTDIANLKAKIEQLTNENHKLKAEIDLNKTKNDVSSAMKDSSKSNVIEAGSANGGTINDDDNKQDNKDEIIKNLENQLNNYKRANKELAMKAVHYNAVNTAQRNLPTIWHSPHININHISTFINKIPIAHKNKLWERHCDDKDKNKLNLSNLDSLMFSIVALCIKINDRTIKTPSQDKLMPRLKIYCKNIKWNVKQKNKMLKNNEMNEKQENTENKENNNENEPKNDKNDQKENDTVSTKKTSKNNDNDNENSEKLESEKEKEKENETENENDNENENEREKENELTIDEKYKLMNKYLLYDDFVNNFHKWLMEGPPPPTPEEQQRRLYTSYGYADDSDVDSDDDDKLKNTFVEMVGKIEDCLQMIDKARF